MNENKTRPITIILLLGMGDLPDIASSTLALALGAKLFESAWNDSRESLAEKMARLDKLVKQPKAQSQKIIFVGLSAGAGLGLAYMLDHPETIHLLYSLSGVLDPRGVDFSHLTPHSNSFREMIERLKVKLTPENIKAQGLDKKVIAYYSEHPGPERKVIVPPDEQGNLPPSDGIVQLAAAKPDWIKVKRYIGKADHAAGIAKALAGDIRRNLKILKGASFD